MRRFGDALLMLWGVAYAPVILLWIVVMVLVTPSDMTAWVDDDALTDDEDDDEILE